MKEARGKLIDKSFIKSIKFINNNSTIKNKNILQKGQLVQYNITKNR